MVARTQPVKLAAMEAHFETAPGVPIVVGGLVDHDAGTVRGALHIPNGLSLLVDHRTDSVVQGLNDFPRALHPNVMLVHTAFDAMVGAGALLIALAVTWLLVRWRRREEAELPRWLLRALVLASPLGFIALQAGWIVTEAGRQPWTIQGVMFTRDAVTPVEGVQTTLALFTLLYLGLGVVVAVMIRDLTRSPAAEAP